MFSIRLLRRAGLTLVCLGTSWCMSGTHTVAKAARPLVYAAIGASETVGVGADNPVTQSWVADLSRKLPLGSRLVNLGKSGAQIGYGLQTELPSAVASNPDLVTVWMVVNDINARVPPEVYRGELDTLLGTLQHRTHAAVYVGNVPELSLLPLYRSFDPQQIEAIVQTYNGIIAAVARAHHVVVVDIYSQSKRTLPRHPEYVSADGFHPSTAGYVDLANLWWARIKTHR